MNSLLLLRAALLMKVCQSNLRITRVRRGSLNVQSSVCIYGRDLSPNWAATGLQLVEEDDCTLQGTANPA